METFGLNTHRIKIMAIYYCDPAGSAGTGDGTSFANRAQFPHEIEAGNTYGSTNFKQVMPEGQHELRVAANPNQHTISNVSTKKRPLQYLNGYNSQWFDGNATTFSTTTGQTQMKKTNHGLQTGDWVEITYAQYWYRDANDGDGSTNNQATNRIPLNGLWKVTVVDKDWVKIDGFTGPYNGGNGSWNTTGFPISYSGNPQTYNCSSEVLEFPNSSSMGIVNITGHERARGKWTANGSATTQDPHHSYGSWGSSHVMMPPGTDLFYIPSGQGTGKCMHYTLPAALDLSAYQGLSWTWEWTNGDPRTPTDGTGASDVSQFSIRLCTDTNGDTPVHTIPLDMRYIPSNSNRRGSDNWDLGTNMNSAIRSIAIYKDHAWSTNVSFGMCNFIAYKSATPLHHRCSMGFNTTDNPHYYFPQYIVNDTTNGVYAVKLASMWEYWYQRYSQGPGYYGNFGCWWKSDVTNGSLHIVPSFRYGRHVGQTARYETSNQWNSQDSNGNGMEFYTYNWHPGIFAHGPQVNTGSSADTNNYNPHVTGFKKISGGWNRTDMSSRTSTTDKTHMDNGWTGYNTGFYGNNSTYSQWYENFQCHRDSWQSECQYLVVKHMFHNCAARYRDDAYQVNYMDVFITNMGENANVICNRSSQEYQGRGSYIPELNNGKWRVHFHGISRASSFQFYYLKGNAAHDPGRQREFDVFNVEGTRCSIYRNDSQANGNVKIPGFNCGGHGRENGYAFWFAGNHGNDDGKITVDGDINALYNGVGFTQSNVKVTINGDVNHSLAPEGKVGAAHGYGTEQTSSMASAIALRGGTDKWRIISNNEPNYSIYIQETPNVVFNGDISIERRIYTGVPLKLFGVQNTDSDPHTLGTQAYIMSANDGGVAGAGKYYGYYWTMEPDTTTVKTAGGKSWKITKTASQGVAKHSIGKIAVASGGTVTIKIWMYRNNAGTTVYGNLIIPADRTVGLTTDVVSNNTTSTAATWTEISASFQPTSAGIIDVQIETVTDSNTSSGSVWFDDMTVEQS